VSAWYVEQFNSEVAEEVQAALAVAILSGYLKAAENCKSRFSMFGWKKAIGANRWFHIEEALLRQRLQHDVLRTMQLPNVSRSHHFGLMRSETTYFTVAKVARPDAKPPRALFRSALQSPVQLSWLDGWETLPASGLCALIIHGPYRDDASRPAFMRIKFMDGADSYLPEQIDLHRKFLADPIEVKRIHIPERQLVWARAKIEKQAT